VAYRQQVRYGCDFSMHERSRTGLIERRMAPQGHRPLANRVTSLSRVLEPSWPPAGEGARRLLARPLYFTLWAFGAAVAVTTRAAVAKRRLPVAEPRTVVSFDQRFDALFEATAGSFDLIGERTGEFLSWRYGDPRGGRNVVRELIEGERLVGYAVVREAGRRAYLSDLLTLPDRPELVDALVADAIEVARRGGAAILECWLPRRHPYRSALRRRGFVDRGRDGGISYHAVEMPQSELAPLDDPNARIHYLLGDTDLV
jgi:hypothetical protein